MNGMDFSLHELVSGANEPALGISGGRILIANSHAQEKLGQIEERFMKRAEDMLYGELAVATAPLST